MKIKKKLILQSIFLAIIPSLLLAIIITQQANKSSFSALESKSKSRLISLRELKKTQIESYLKSIESQLITLAENIAVVDAADKFISSFQQASINQEQLQKSQAQVKAYYLSEFSNAYKNKNNESSTLIVQNLDQLDPSAIYFQDKYIASNHFSLGNKDKLLSAGESQYDAIHTKYHSMFKSYQQKFGFYDVFIVDANTGHVVYSVFKELDFATSLNNGPYANSGLAKAFKQALTLKSQQVAIVDFDSYFPSYDQTASFIASPIIDENNKTTAVLIFQMPIDGINQIMTSEQKWQEVGLGLSGETYLVGPDQKLRSESRFLIEDKNNYIRALEQSNNQPNIDKIKSFNSALGLQLVQTTGVSQALSGKSGFLQFPDYRGVEVLSAFTHVNYGSKQWALMAEIDVDEAFADAVQLSDDLHFDAVIGVLIIGLISITIGLIIAKIIVTPLDTLVERINDISDGNGDLTVKLSLAQRNDEIGDVGKSFNHFVEKIRVVVSEIDMHAGLLASSSEELSVVTNETNSIVGLQKSKTELTTQVMSEFSGSISDIAENSLNTATLTQQANQESLKGAQLSEEAHHSIQSLVESVDSAAKELKLLNTQVEEITSILSVIDSIADQTNLLALNAAIEAARAGESGRGFSVVADEVRTLAAKTQESTVEIQRKIEGLKMSSTKSVSAMSHASQEANHGIQLVQDTANSLRILASLIADVSFKNAENATVAKQQSVSVHDVHQNIIDIDSYTESTSSASLQTSQSSSELAKLAINMSSLVQQFKY